jgi:predicted enzyme related to lactoylglutathione lyase
MMKMSLTYELLYVDNPQESEKFYTQLLGVKAVQSAPTFVLFVMPNGMKLGLWIKSDVEPKVTAQPGASEACFEADDVDAAFQEWKKQGVQMLQEPTDMDFGRTFVGVDPDGHRLRVFKLADNPK